VAAGPRAEATTAGMLGRRRQRRGVGPRAASTNATAGSAATEREGIGWRHGLQRDGAAAWREGAATTATRARRRTGRERGGRERTRRRSWREGKDAASGHRGRSSTTAGGRGGGGVGEGGCGSLAASVSWRRRGNLRTCDKIWGRNHPNRRVKDL